MKNTITLYGSCSQHAEFNLYVDDVLAYQGSPHNVLELASVELDMRKYYSHFKVECTKGRMEVGTISKKYTRDINNKLSLNERQQVWNDLLANKEQTVDTPFLHYTHPYKYHHQWYGTHDFRRANVKINGELLDVTASPNDPDYRTYKGWCHYIERGGVVEFDYSDFTPADVLNFVTDQQLSEEVFTDNEVLSTTR